MAFWDASALVPLCCYQSASARMRQLLREHREMVVWWGAPVEARSALARLRRQAGLSTRGLEEAKRRLARLQRFWIESLPTSRERSLAEEATEHYALRSLDAFQLAAALVWSNERPRRRPFVCLDTRLARAAEQAGFQVMS